jgi:hypothetical protein
VNERGAGSEPSEWLQFALLRRTLHRRLFEGELAQEGRDHSEMIPWVLPLLIAPPTLITFWLFPKYALVVDLTPQLFDQASRGDRLFFIGYSMVAVALLTVLTWNALFPDCRDASVLGALPVRGRTVAAAKLTVLASFLLAMAAILNLPSALGFALASGMSKNAGVAIGYLFAHLLSTLSAGAFAAFSLLTLGTLVRILRPGAPLAPLSSAIQLTLFIVLVEGLLFLPGFLAEIDGTEPCLTGVVEASWVPPLWYLGLYEVLLGSRDASCESFATLGIAAVGVLPVLGVGLYAASYRAIARGFVEIRRAPVRGWKIRAAIAKWAGSLLTDPVERSTLEFVLKTTARSEQHRLLVTLYLALSLSVIVTVAAGRILGRFELYPFEPTVPLLALPLVLSFVTLTGLRLLFTKPTALDANWVFRLAESRGKTSYRLGIQKAMLLTLAPIAVVTMPLYGILWGFTPAVRHTLFWFLMAMAHCEGLLIGFRRIPFTCSCTPGRTNLKLLWPVHLLVLSLYAYFGAALSAVLLDSPYGWAAACLLVVVGLAAAGVFRGLSRFEGQPLVFEEPLQRTTQTIGLADTA